MATTKTNEPLVFNIEVPAQKIWDKDNGEWLPPKPYSTPAWVKYHEVLRINDGHAQTQDLQIAMELVDMGAIVTPDPRPIAQEQYAQALKLETETNPIRLYELAKYVTETNEWRARHGVQPLSVKAPEVGRPVSALLMQQG
jgi:hypothetical protein